MIVGHYKFLKHSQLSKPFYFETYLKQKMEEKYVSDFDPKTFSFKTSKSENKGLNMNSLKLLDLMSHQSGDTEIGYPIQSVIKKALKTLFKYSATVSDDHGYEN